MAQVNKVSADKISPTISIGSWHIALVLVAVGLVISGYLTYIKLTGAPVLCVDGGGFDCAAVENSPWATLLGIPVSVLGLASYIFIGVLLASETKLPEYRLYIQIILFAVLLIGWLFSMWLVYVQAVILQAFCQWCLMHELNITILFGMSMYRLWKLLR